MIRIKEEQYASIIAHAREKSPPEACGLLGDVEAPDGRRVEKVYFLTNADESHEHFSMLPEEQFAAVKDMRAKGWRLLANFHSPPASPPRPSEEDKRLAFDELLSYLILSLAEDTPVLKAFRIDGEKNVTTEEIIIE